MDEENLNLNEGQENVVDFQNNEAVNNEPDQTNNAGPVEPQQGNEPQQKPAQTPEENAKFAEMRRAREAAEAKAAQIERDYNISRQYGADYGVHSEAEIAAKYAAQGIKTFEQFQQAVKAQEMADKGIDPDEVKRLAEELPEVKEARQMKRDRESMVALQEIAPEITNASQIPSEVLQAYIQGKDLASEYAIWKLKNDAMIRAKEKANAENAKGSMGSVSTNGTANDGYFTKEQVSKMTAAEVARNYEKICESTKKW
jgi:hypothetical protein